MTDEGDEIPPYRVGYGRPPAHTRFRRGQSGNPRGRERGTRNLRSIVESVLSERVPVTINGTTKKIPIQEAVVRKVVQKALQGELRAVAELARMCPTHFSDAAQEASTALNEHDNEIIQQALRRLAGEEGE